MTEDITFNNLLPLYNSKLLKAYASLDDRVARLGRLVKFWAKSRNLGSRWSRFGFRPLPEGNTAYSNVRSCPPPTPLLSNRNTVPVPA